MEKIMLVTKDELETRLRICLEQRRMPDYFLYLGDSGVNNWLTLSNSEEFPITSQLTDLLKENVHSLVVHFPKRLTVISLGVGSGEKERMLLEALATKVTLSYYAVDISSEMVDQALKTVADINVEKTGLVAFLEDLSSLQPFWNSPVLLCLLGNGFSTCDPDSLLENVRAQLQSKDLFLFDCHLFPDQRQELDLAQRQVPQMYRSKLNLRFNLEPLVQRGMDQDNCVFHVKLLPIKTSVGIAYKITKWLEITRDSVIPCGQCKVFLKAGDTISRGATYKYTRHQVEGYIRHHGLQAVGLYLSLDKQYLLALVRKRPLSKTS